MENYKNERDFKKACSSKHTPLSIIHVPQDTHEYCQKHLRVLSLLSLLSPLSLNCMVLQHEVTGDDIISSCKTLFNI